MVWRCSARILQRTRASLTGIVWCTLYTCGEICIIQWKSRGRPDRTIALEIHADAHAYRNGDLKGTRRAGRMPPEYTAFMAVPIDSHVLARCVRHCVQPNTCAIKSKTLSAGCVFVRFGWCLVLTPRLQRPKVCTVISIKSNIAGNNKVAVAQS